MTADVYDLASRRPETPPPSWQPLLDAEEDRRHFVALFCRAEEKRRHLARLVRFWTAACAALAATILAILIAWMWG